MPRLNYQHLYYFWVVAREGSIAAATRKLFLAQPTISAQIHALERQLGEKLFTRRGRGLALTPAGETALRYADEIFALGAELGATLRGATGGAAQRLAMGISDALPKLTTYRLLEPALALGADARLVLRVDRTERLLADLAIHALDLVLADAPVPPTQSVRVFSHLLGESGVSVFGTPDLARRHGGFPASLDGAPFLLQTPNTAMRRSLDDWFAAAGIRPRVVAEVEDPALLQVLGQHGMGMFAAPQVVEAEVTRQHGVEVIGRLDGARERFYAISAERRLTHPAVLAIRDAARDQLFGLPASPP